MNALRAIRENLELQGLRLEDVTTMRDFLDNAPGTDRADYAGWNRAYRQFFANTNLQSGDTELVPLGSAEPSAPLVRNPARPSRFALEVQSLPVPGWLVEVEVDAVFPPGSARADVAVHDRGNVHRVTQASPIDITVPHSARVWNYWLGGKDNYQVDRDAGDDFAAKCPEIFSLAKLSRQFLVRAVRHLATEAGIRQFLDIGTGLPTMDNTHQVAQRAAPDCRIVYVDNDPLVLAHARALLVNTTPEGVTAYVAADLHEPEQIVADAKNILNFNEPIGVLFMGVLGHVADHDEARSIVATVMGATPSGSYLTLWDGTDTSEDLVRANADYAATGGVPYLPRSPKQIDGYFDGLEKIDPGLVPVSRWRPEIGGVDAAAVEVAGYGAVARKP